MWRRLLHDIRWILTGRVNDSGASEALSGTAASDEDRRQVLLRRINRAGDVNDPATPRPLVALEEFFEGNEDTGSIGYNLSDPPSPQEFYELLKEMRDRADVADVVVEVKDIEDPEGWPSTDTIWIITSASPADVKAWFPTAATPDDIIEGWRDDYLMEPYPRPIPDGMRPLGAWWD